MAASETAAAPAPAPASADSNGQAGIGEAEIEEETSVIQPPPDVRAIIDRAAMYVARNGASFEARIVQAGGAGVNFAFLQPSDPYHAYYRRMVTKTERELLQQKQQPQQQASDAAATVPAAGDSAGPGAGDASLSNGDGANTEASDAAKALEPPAPTQWVLRHPQLLALDLAIIKLTAQVAARNGRGFLVDLSRREFHNPQFFFLKQHNPLHGYFMALFRSYLRILTESKEIVPSIQSTVLDRAALLQRVQHAAAYRKQQAESEEAKAAEREEEQHAMASIDWHDFVVVATVEFTDADMAAVAQATGDAADTAMPDARPAPAPGPTTSDQPLKVVEGYQPRAKRGRDDAATLDARQECPLCHQRIPIAEMAEHMRIELLDPRYNQERAQRVKDAAVSNMAPDAAVLRNLKNLASKRSDIFASDAPAASAAGPAAESSATTTTTTGSSNTAAAAAGGGISSSRLAGQSLDQSLQQISAGSAEAASTAAIASLPGLLPVPPGQAPVPMPAPVAPMIQPVAAVSQAPADEPEAKRARVDIQVLVQLPEDASHREDWKLDGSVLRVHVNAGASVRDLKARIADAIGMPGNKQKLKFGASVLTDKDSLASAGVGSDSTVELAVKTRGGRRK